MSVGRAKVSVASTILRTGGIAALAMLALAGAASAQATRTWVSGVGDDANPCSRTAPCKTFAGAISKTAARGQINVLDPGGFGAVTITKAITINSEFVEAGVLVSGTNAIIVNAGVNDIVTLRGLDIEGLDTGLNGIRFLSGKVLNVENCTIERFTGYALSFESTTPNAQLTVSNSIFRNNLGSGGAGGGVLLRPAVGSAANATFDNVISTRNRVGFQIEDRSKASIRSSTISNNNGFGVLVLSTVGAEANVTSSLVSNNLQAGIRSDGNLAVIRMTDISVFDNGTGVAGANGGVVLSYSNNRIGGNTSDGAPTATLPQQ
ncbi:MAG: right-handed parallel beta-helix repeat-containing protein [Thermoanaerobaculia bacterium]